MTNSIAVGLAEIQLSKDPEDVLVAFGLGSCIGIGMYDPAMKLGGMLHAVLPKANISSGEIAAKYVDSGIRMLFDEMLKAGAIYPRLIVRMAGGANMLNLPSSNNSFDIGTRNIDSAYEVLKDLNIKLRSEEVGGNIGRTVRLYIADGRMTIRMMGGAEREF